MPPPSGKASMRLPSTWPGKYQPRGTRRVGWWYSPMFSRSRQAALRYGASCLGEFIIGCTSQSMIG